MKVTIAIAKGVALAVIAIILSGCGLTVLPDGTRIYRADPAVLAEALRAIPIHSDK